MKTTDSRKRGRGRMAALALTTTLWLTGQPLHAEEQPLTLEQAERQALANDRRLAAARLATAAIEVAIDAAGELEDPQARIALQNLPVDSFDTSREAMTQLVVGIKQRFPSGDSRRLRRAKAVAQAAESGIELEEKRQQLLRAVRTAWLGVWAARAEKRLIDEERRLLQEMLPLLEGAYRAGRSRQLELARLRVQLARNEAAQLAVGERERAQRAVLLQWIDDADSRRWPDALPPALRRIEPLRSESSTLLARLSARQQVLRQEVALARERFKPGWGTELGYGIRDSRSDFLTLGLTLSLPVATARRQSPELARQEKMLASVAAEHQFRRNELAATLTRLQRETAALTAQIEIYRARLIPELERIRELVDSDYSVGKARATDVIEADSGLVEGRRDLLRQEIERGRKIIEMRYLAGEVEK